MLQPIVIKNIDICQIILSIQFLVCTFLGGFTSLFFPRLGCVTPVGLPHISVASGRSDIRCCEVTPPDRQPHSFPFLWVDF